MLAKGWRARYLALRGNGDPMGPALLRPSKAGLVLVILASGATVTPWMALLPPSTAGLALCYFALRSDGGPMGRL